ncbi:hypothetical protein Tco_1005112 [Tanacetum coccineum]|uniref:Uncharacterized protein n=1 Tax=Tanacetum coccineum TaxID=301880 RepID=A0ABQ5FEV0_9ASTR
MGILRDVLCQVGVTIILARFLILDIPMDKDVPIVVGLLFLRSLPISLQHNDWMPSYADNSTRKVESDGVWQMKCSIVDPYENDYNQGYETKATDKELSKFYKLSDIMSPDWF